MLTLFTVPKPFQGHIAVIQGNAIRSWLKVARRSSILLFGKEAGVAEFAQEHGLTHIPDVATNAFGTPLLDSVFAQAFRNSVSRYLCYANADIILYPHFTAALQAISHPRFLMLGRRMNVTLDASVPMDDEASAAAILDQARAHGQLAPPTYIDYFAFPRIRVFAQIPPFAVGRPAWDNWMVYHARKNRIPVIDASPVVTALHQNHDYSHIPSATGVQWNGPEAETNRMLARNKLYTINDATHVLTDRGLQPAIGQPYLAQRLYHHPVSEFVRAQVRPLVHLARRWKKAS